jgi:hypothetical protein
MNEALTLIQDTEFSIGLSKKQKIAWLILREKPTATFQEMIECAKQQFGVAISKNAITALKKRPGFKEELERMYQELFTDEEIFLVARAMLNRALGQNGTQDAKNIMQMTGRLEPGEGIGSPQNVVVQVVGEEEKTVGEGNPDNN